VTNFHEIFENNWYLILCFPYFNPFYLTSKELLTLDHFQNISQKTSSTLLKHCRERMKLSLKLREKLLQIFAILLKQDKKKMRKAICASSNGQKGRVSMRFANLR
jgi:hypothetical protein